jgi:serine/threonine protein kinase
MADRVGQKFGNYQLLRLLGEGTFAQVYLAEHQYLEIPAAVKILHTQMRPNTHAAFQREAHTIAHLQHPHIVRVLDFGIQDQTPYLVMEYIQGGTLRSLHPEGTRLSYEQIVEYVKQIASALDYAHEQRVIHRDIKPENILLNARGEVVLSDFGIAVVQHTLASFSERKMAGTPLYMAPEQIQDQPCAASDQYALGVIVYEWLCGEPPFRGPFMAVLAQHMHEAPPSLCARLPHLAPPVEDAVFGALAKDPQQRFATVQDFAFVLEEACFSTQPLPLHPSIEVGSSEHRPQPIMSPVPATSKQHHMRSLQQPTSSTSSPVTPEQILSQRPFPLAVVSIAAPADLSYLEQWEAQLRPLAQAGILTVWSDRHILPGMPRQQQIYEHLEQANLIILLVSADFFSSDDCIALMERALQCQQHESTYVVPLLLRSVEWDASPLASLSCIPSNGLPIAAWPDRDIAFDLCVRDLRRLLGYETRPVPRPDLTTAPSSITQRHRQVLLRKVRSFWIEGVLNHSLHGAALLALGLQTQPDAVANPWHLILQEPETTPRPLPMGTRITQMYDASERELLILGAPGAGKTTLLLELARDLLERAESNEQHPIPVVFNLSSWAVKRQSLDDWLVEELNIRYLVSPKLAQALVQAEQILPLLDGLDEVGAKERTACIEAINAYRLEHSWQPPVVCSRSADYLAQVGRVRLSSAVMVQPLTQEQVLDYLSSAGSQLEALRVALQRDPDLQELATTPLMLNILTLAYQGTPLSQIAPLGTLPVKQQQIFATYVQRMLTRRGAPTRYTQEQTLPWLSFLAQTMKKRNQTIFYVEHMQPDWLVGKRMRRKYDWLAVRLPYMLTGVLVGLAPYLLLFRDSNIWTPFLPELTLLGGLLGWLLSGGSADQQSLTGNRGEVRGVHWYRFLQQLGLATLLGSVVGLSFWKYREDLLRGLVAGLCFAVCCLLLLLLKRNISLASVQRKPQKHPVRRKVVLNATLVGLVVGLSNALGIAVHTELTLRVVYGILFFLFGGLSTGLLSVLLIGRHAAIQPTDRLIWTWQSLGKSLFSKRHMRLALQMTGLGLLLFSAVFWLVGVEIATIPVLGLIAGSVFGLCYWLLVGFFRGVASITIDDQLRVIPNQGIRHSALNALRYGLVVAVLVGSGGWLLSTSWLSGLIIGLSVGLLAGLFNGGLACLRHFILRILLWRSGAIPWDYPHFLDAVTERILLRKVGGGYIFVHRLLLDYLATLGINELVEQGNAAISPALLPCGHASRPNAKFCSVCGAVAPS